MGVLEFQDHWPVTMIGFFFSVYKRDPTLCKPPHIPTYIYIYREYIYIYKCIQIIQIYIHIYIYTCVSSLRCFLFQKCVSSCPRPMNWISGFLARSRNPNTPHLPYTLNPTCRHHPFCSYTENRSPSDSLGNLQGAFLSNQLHIDIVEGLFFRV